MADITNIETRIPGVNQDTNYVLQKAHLIDCAEHSGILAVGTHDLAVIPPGEMLTGLKLAVIGGATSSGSATVQFKASFGGTAGAIGNATAIANLAAGNTLNIPVSGIKAYDADTAGILQFTVGTAALTAFKFLLIVETIPVHEFLNRG